MNDNNLQMGQGSASVVSSIPDRMSPNLYRSVTTDSNVSQSFGIYGTESYVLKSTIRDEDSEEYLEDSELEVP